MRATTTYDCSPVAIGAIGGSGTRLIAQFLKELGFYIGEDLNESNDNLWFTLLFLRVEILSVSDREFAELFEIFLKGMLRTAEFTELQVRLIHKLTLFDRNNHPANWFLERANSLLASVKDVSGNIKDWGWKAPNTHIIIDRLQRLLPKMRYIHVVRNGLDMAHSENQNQLKLWGAHFLGTSYEVLPYYSLKYWCKVHQRVLDLCKPMGNRFFLLNYDQLCLHPKKTIKSLLNFLEIQAADSQIQYLSAHMRIPPSIGRFKQQGIQMFDPADVSFVRQLGFDT